MARNDHIMLGASAALMLAVAPALSGGIERTNQTVAPIFEKGNYLELGLTRVSPSISGYDYYPGNPATGDVAKSYSTYSLAYKRDFTPNLSGAIIIDTPFGADILYPGGGSPLLGNTAARVDSTQVTGILRWHGDNNFGVHGGLRVSRADAGVDLNGLAYGPFHGYTARMDRDTAWGWLVGVSYEIPDIAARVALTYNSPIKHDFRTTEGGLPDPSRNGVSQTEVKTPRSWNLDFQSGVAEDTLVFGSIRWVKWSEFKVDPQGFTDLYGEGLVDLEDSTTFTLGVGRRFDDTWSGSASFTFEKRGKDLVSPLAPTSGRKGVTLAAIYTRDNVKLTTGVNYTWLGDAKPETGNTARAQMKDNHAVTVGMRLGFSF